MNTYKVIFTNTSNNLDFVLIDAHYFGGAFEIGTKEIGIDRMKAIEEVTNKFVNTNGDLYPATMGDELSAPTSI